METTLETLEALERETPGAIDWAYDTSAARLRALGFTVNRETAAPDTLLCERCGKSARTGPAKRRWINGASELTHVGGCP